MEEKRTYHVKIGNIVKEYESGTAYHEIVKEHQREYPHEIVLVFVDGKLQELHKRLKKDCELSFVMTSDTIGHEAYKRSMSFLLVKAVYDGAGHKNIDKVRMHFALGPGYYCTITGETRVNDEFLEQVEARMHELVEANLPIKKRTVNTDEAIGLFGQYGMYDKEELFQYRRVSKVNLYSINEFEDYYYGYMLYSTGSLKYFKLHRYDEGFVLQMPTIEEPEIVPEFVARTKFFQVMKESIEWGDVQNIETVGDLNHNITSGDVQETVLVQEAMQEKRIAEIAQMIVSRPEIRFVLIAGPSSSGKTTFSHRLSVQLRANGMHPHPIAVDNYFKEREETPKDKDGNYNFEGLCAVDIELFENQMQELLDGKEVIIPNFNFVKGHKEFFGKPMKLGEHDILVIEGIHCLNPELTKALADEKKFKIYISALTQLNIDEHNRIPTTDGRLLRRIVRDSRTRGASAKKTIQMWPSVRRGEEENIFPFQEEADVMFNSALIYELAVLKPYVEAQLFGVERDCPEYIEAKRLLKFLDYFVGIGSEKVPTNSLLREFIGGGCFRV